MSVGLGERVVESIEIVRRGYDELGERFGAWVERNPSDVRAWFLQEVLARIPADADVLELGCGPGTAAAALAARGRYIGIDLSDHQLTIARRRVPTANFVQGDFTGTVFADAAFDVVVAFYVFNHVPRALQAPTFGRVSGWLRPGGRFMASLGVGGPDDEVQDDWLGVPMFFAGFERETNERHLREAGFELELSETRTEIEEGEGEVTFQWVIARKPESAG